MSGTTAAIVEVSTPGQANEDPSGYNSMWGQKHWTDSTKKWTGKPYEGANLKMVFEKAKLKS